MLRGTLGRGGMAGRSTSAPGCVAAALLGCGCQPAGGYEDFELASPGTCVNPSAEWAGPVPRGSPMVRVQGLHEEGCFWVDRHETTVAEYQAFLDATEAGSASWTGLVASLVRKSSEAPAPEAHCEAQPGPSDPRTVANSCVAEVAAGGENAPWDGEKPVRCVTWCDAAAYCEWLGRRLCLQDLLSGAWESRSACGGESLYPYPYGVDYRARRCNVDQAAAGCPFQVAGPDLGCEGPRPREEGRSCASAWGAEELLGNVREWTATCRSSSDAGAPAADGAPDCVVFGGSFATHPAGGPAQVTCLGGDRAPARTQRPDLGLRCCASAAAP